MLTNQTKRLLEEVRQLSRDELQEFVAQVVALNAQYNAHSLPQKESELFARINETIPAQKRARFEELVAKRRAVEITDDERNELLALVDEIENSDAKRVQALGELAALRGVTLPEIMKQLGLRRPKVT